MTDNKKTKQEWAPARIWLQRGVGDDGSHTWCSDSQGEHEQAEYVRVDVQAPAVEAGARGERVSMIQTLMLDWINARAGKEAKAVWNRIEENLVALDRASDQKRCDGSGAVAVSTDDWSECPACHGAGCKPVPHQWNDDGESCVKCGDKDWMADSSCSERLIARASDAEAGEPIDYDRVVQICEAHGIGLPVDCIEMVVEIIRLAAPQPAGAQQAARGLRDEQRRMLIRVSECLYVAGYQGLSGELVNAFSALLAAKGDGQ